MDTLDADDLEMILIIARNGQSGRITEREIKLLVEAYREWHGIPGAEMQAKLRKGLVL